MSLNKAKTLRTAEKYVLQGKIPAAIDEYRKVVDADPADMTTINTLGDLYVRAGRIPDAITNFSRIADSYRDSGFTLKAIAMLKKMSKLDPTNIDTSMKLANLYSQQGLFVEARQQYLQVADAYARAGQSRKALDAYQKIADLDPSNTSVRIKLGEIYSREGLVEQAHEAFIMAGAEFMRRGDSDQALAANLKALAIKPEGRQALTAIVSIYTQQGQADRAINILCDAFERNPGDVELLTILGRTYLAAGFMDDAERTFLSLVELDRNRYNYLLDVGRKFLQNGDLDRAAEQIDGCLDVLIAKREEDKGIDFLRRVLDRDPDHLGALRRLAQIFMRIREDHNLIATLNSLAEAAMRKNDNEAAVDVLKELVRLEPDEPRHRQRLYNLGIRDIAEPGAPDVVRATGPLDYQSAAFDDAFVIRQISEAEILAGHGQMDHAVSMLKEILNHAPENVQVRLKLKDIYLRAALLDKAAEQCVDLAHLYEMRGEGGKAAECIVEARQLNPMLAPAQEDGPWHESAPAISDSFDIQMAATTGGDHFGTAGASDPFDLSRYETGPLTDQMGFVTAPPRQAEKHAPVSSIDPKQPPMNGSSGDGRSFSYSDTFIDGPSFGGDQPGDLQNQFFTATGNLPSDTMPSLLRDELDGIDFYIAQGYIDIAHDTLNRLREEHGDHPEILSRYQRLGIAAAPTREIEGDALNRLGYSEPPPPLERTQAHAPAEISFSESVSDTGFGFEDPFAAGQNGKAQIDLPPLDSYRAAATGELMSPESNGHSFAEVPADEGMLLSVTEPEGLPQEEMAVPFMVQQDSAPLSDDLLVRFNTSELPKAYADDYFTETHHDAATQDYAVQDLAQGEFTEQDLTGQPLSEEDLSGYGDPLSQSIGGYDLTGPDLSSQDVTGQNPAGHEITDYDLGEYDLSAQEITPHEMTGQGMTGHEITSHDLSGHDFSVPDVRTHEVAHSVQEPVNLVQDEVVGDGHAQTAFEADDFLQQDLAGDSLPSAINAQEEFAEEDFAYTETAGEEAPIAAPVAPPVPERPLRPRGPAAGTAELVASLLAGMDESFDDLLGSPAPRSISEPDVLHEAAPEPKPAAGDLHLELREMFEDLKGNTQELDPITDYETHYSLGLAYKDMELWDDAIEQFQLAFKHASKLSFESESIQCCNLLGVCFKQKAMPKLAVMWFSRGVKVPNRTEDEYQALRFEIGLCYEEMGDVDKAIDAFSEVYGIDVNYRHVSEKLRELQSAKTK